MHGLLKLSLSDKQLSRRVSPAPRTDLGLVWKGFLSSDNPCDAPTIGGHIGRRPNSIVKDCWVVSGPAGECKKCDVPIFTSAVVHSARARACYQSATLGFSGSITTSAASATGQRYCRMQQFTTARQRLQRLKSSWWIICKGKLFKGAVMLSIAECVGVAEENAEEALRSALGRVTSKP